MIWSKTEIARRRREAESALANAADQSREVDESRSTLRSLLQGLAAINEQNNFAPKMLQVMKGDT